MDEKEVKNLADLARLDLTDDEIKTYGKEMGDVLGYVKSLSEFEDVDDSLRVESASTRNVFREDEEPHESGIFKDSLLKEAPETKDGFVKVKKIL